MQTPEFISKADVLAIHKRQVEKFGGLDGVRDEDLLDSALAQPQATFFGELLHSTIPAQAAAYLYHLAKNHPFLDANKRTAFATTIAFLGINGYELNMTEEEAYVMVMQVAQGEMTKEELASLLEQHIRLE